MPAQDRINILLINPNSSFAMTSGMTEALKTLNLPPHIAITTATAPSPSPPSINNDADINLSATVCLDVLTRDYLVSHSVSAILVACFSIHPLVHSLVDINPDIAVTGIFEASVLTSLSLLSKEGKWGILTTGPFWEEHLSSGVADLLGVGPHATSPTEKFAGVFSTGLNAGDFHNAPLGEVRRRLRDAAARLLDSRPSPSVECVVMGCAGMAGLEDLIRDVAIEKYGEGKGKALYIIDGVKAGIGALLQMLESRRLFRA